MSYTKTVWVNNQSPDINAENLNHIEQGIYDAHTEIATKITMPDSGTTGQVLTKTANAVEWSPVVTTFNGSTGAVTYTAPVSSVNGATGAVVIGSATTSSAGLMSAQDKTDLGTLMADYSSALTALGVI